MGQVALRATGPGDLAAVADLLSRRDGEERTVAGVRAALFDLAPEHLLAWIAWVDDEPAGLTTLYRRALRCGDRTLAAGYWAHLFVDERHRRRLLYPRLVAAMLEGARQAGLEALYTATRRREVAAAHVRLGFRDLGQRAVRARPLRPWALAAKVWGWPRAVAAVGAPLDSLYGALTARRPGDRTEVEELDPDSEAASRVVDRLSGLGEGGVRQTWTPASFRRRFAGSLDGARYAMLGTRREGELESALVYRVARRQGVRVGVVMDLICDPRTATVSAPRLLRSAAYRLRRSGVDALLALDDPGDPTNPALEAAGFRPSAERYRFLLWPGELLDRLPSLADLGRWRFAFSDHDAF